ncbi:hypothetical protein KFE25_006431 [Diacronema lutheri]|uniref:DUF819 family protein n=1 Tax=Diacronema lutheri TaxID=2081491 RepID=A0A8J5XIZ0_DIALT|nr:hypothetical protein KFE25_006431 [Diacronema lutheri]
MRPPLLGDVRTALATGACGLAGTIAERHSLPGGLVAFAGQCALSNAGAVPAAHAVYEFAWSGALPMSLTLAVLASTCLPGAPERDGAPADKLAADGESALAGVGAGFAIATVGSLVGVAAAFALALHAPVGGARHMPRALAAQVSGAVLATYVGGAANFAEVSERVALPASVVGALAACDIATMGVYFALLSLLARSERARRWIEGGASASASAPPTPKPARAAPGAAPSDAPRATGRALAAACGLLALLAGRSVDAFAGSSTLVAVGTACALGLACARFLPADGARRVRHGAAELAPACLNFFYAAVGASARPAEIAAAGSAGALFLSTALCLHVLVAGAAAAVANRLPPRVRPRRPIRLNELLVGSNAAIGGPSTAAAFAAPLGGRLVVPAAIWGIVGYAVGTLLGVHAWSALR